MIRIDRPGQSDQPGSGSESLDWGSLRARGIEWYRRNGIDFAELNKKFEVRG
jgi:hypothetical protein